MAFSVPKVPLNPNQPTNHIALVGFRWHCEGLAISQLKGNCRIKGQFGFFIGLRVALNTCMARDPTEDQIVIFAK